MVDGASATPERKICLRTTGNPLLRIEFILLFSVSKTKTFFSPSPLFLLTLIPWGFRTFCSQQVDTGGWNHCVVGPLSLLVVVELFLVPNTEYTLALFPLVSHHMIFHLLRSVWEGLIVKAHFIIYVLSILLVTRYHPLPWIILATEN